MFAVLLEYGSACWESPSG